MGNNQITTVDPSPRVAAAKAAVAQYEGYKGVITNEEEKVWISGELANLKQQQAVAKRDLASLTDPQLIIRRESMATTKAAERIFGPLLQYFETGERILKDEIVRYELQAENQRLLKEAELQRQAAEEQRRLEEKARQESEAAARANEEELRRVQELEAAGQQREADEARAQADANLERAAESVQQTFEEAEAVVEQAVVTSSSVKVAGQSLTGKWVAEVVDVMELLRGIAELGPARSTHPTLVPVTPPEVVRVKYQGRLVPLPVFKGKLAEIDGIEINLAWLNVKAREQEKNFNYRGMRSRYVQDLRVRV